MKKLMIIVLALLPVVSFAAKTSGSAELGYLARSGNTDSSDLNAKAQVARQYEAWKHSGHIALELSKENDTRTAERYLAGLKSEYRLSAQDYVFATVDYENDKFGAYESRWSETIGYGRRLLNKERHTLDLELGAGARQLKLATGDSSSEGIARLGLNYFYGFATGADFSNKFLSESGSGNTLLQNESAISMPLLDNVSLKVGYTVRHNTSVPAGTQKTDTLTAVNVAYRF